MKSVKKRDNRVVEFDRSKIVSAIQRAFIEVDGSLSDSSTKIANTIADEIAVIPEDKSVEEIQDLVIYDLMDTDRKDVAKAYTEYRFKRSLVRDSHNTTDNAIMELLNHTNEEVNEENSNKDPEIVSVQRDYIAGITSRMLLGVFCFLRMLWMRMMPELFIFTMRIIMHRVFSPTAHFAILMTCFRTALSLMVPKSTSRIVLSLPLRSLLRSSRQSLLLSTVAFLSR